MCVFFFTNFQNILVLNKMDNSTGGSIWPLEMFCNTVVWSPLPLGSFCSIMEAYYVTVGRGDFKKKSQKVPAFWKMAAVTVIRLSVNRGIPSCTALTCRRCTESVESMK